MAENMLLCETDVIGVCTLTLNRPAIHNAFNEELIDLLITKLTEIEKDDSVRLVVLEGLGKSFSAGADLNWMQKMVDYSKEENIADAMQLANLMNLLNRLSKPTLAIVHGAAIGGGVGLVACCDIAVASEEAFFCFSEVKLGLTPAVISPYVVQKIGETQARRYFLTAEKIAASTALQIGLVHEVVSEENLAGVCDSIIKQILENEATAVSAAKELVFAVANKPINESLICGTASRIAELRISSAAQRRLKKFLQRD